MESEGCWLCSASISFDDRITTRRLQGESIRLLLSGRQFGNVVYYVKYCHRFVNLTGLAEKPFIVS